jgi:hypothetical protein
MSDSKFIKPMDKKASKQMQEFSEKLTNLVMEYPDMVALFCILEHSTQDLASGLIGRADQDDIRGIGLLTVETITGALDTLSETEDGTEKAKKAMRNIHATESNAIH